MSKLADNLEIAARIVRDPSLKWEVFNNNTWGKSTRDAVSVVADGFDIRLEPEPKYVPWTLKTRPQEVIIVRKKDRSAEALVICWHQVDITLGGYGMISYKRLLDAYTLLDGSPCGTLSS